jgi:hypothetical protein
MLRRCVKMAVKRIDDKSNENNIILRVTIPTTLMEDIRDTKALCKENGFVFDIKPDVKAAVENAIREARKAVKEAVG